MTRSVVPPERDPSPERHGRLASVIRRGWSGRSRRARLWAVTGLAGGLVLSGGVATAYMVSEPASEPTSFLRPQETPTGGPITHATAQAVAPGAAHPDSVTDPPPPGPDPATIPTAHPASANIPPGPPFTGSPPPATSTTADPDGPGR